jgi:hypothetical protein
MSACSSVGHPGRLRGRRHDRAQRCHEENRRTEGRQGALHLTVTDCVVQSTVTVVPSANVERSTL